MQINFQTLNIFYKNRQTKQVQEPKIATASNPFATINPFKELPKDTLEISFGSSHCSVQNFEVKNIGNLHCPACGLVMLNEKQINSFANEISYLKGEDLVKALEKYEDESVITKKEARDKTRHGIFRPIKKQIVDVIKNLAQENPDLSLAQLVSKHAKECIDSLISKQLIVFDELENYINENIDNEAEKKELLENLNKYRSQAKGEGDDDFSRKRFIFDIKKGVVNPKQKAEVEKIASKLPTSENDVNSFFVKYSKKEKMNSKLIAERLVNTSKPTAEHLIPRSKGGKDRISNYICDCAECNSKRGNMDFYDWIQTLPNFEERLQAYIYDVQDAIDGEQLSPRYDSYIEQVIDTIGTISEGEISLEIPDSKNPKKVAMVMQKRERELEKIKSTQAKLEARKKSLEEEIKRLEASKFFDEADQYREIQEELEKIIQDSVRINNQMIKLRKPLYILKVALAELEDKVDKAKTPDEKRKAQKELADKKEEYETEQKKYEALENKLGKLKKKKIRLKKQRRIFVAKEIALKQHIEELSMIMIKIQQAKEKLMGLGSVEQKEQELSAKLQAIEATIAELISENEQIEAEEGFNPNNRSEYNAYMHKTDLLFAAESLLQSKNYKKLGAQAGKTRELIELSKKMLEQETKELAQKSEVKYFINLSRIKTESEKKENTRQKLAEANQQSKQAENLRQEIQELYAGKSEKSLRRELDDLIQERKTRQEIYEITDKREALEHITRTIRRNSLQIKKLENYAELTNSQWAEIISFIDLDDIYLY